MPPKADKIAADAADAADDLEHRAANAKAVLGDAARRAERALHDGVETVRARSRVYVDAAGHQLDTAQKYVVERVKERPVTAMAAGLGVGLLLGMLLSGRNNRHPR